jgi:hypothetical protein
LAGRRLENALARRRKEGEVSEDLEAFAPETDSPLDLGIREAVLILRRGGVETFESCEGGEGHSSSEPFVRFDGSPWAGYHAFSVAMEHGLPIRR